MHLGEGSATVCRVRKPPHAYIKRGQTLADASVVGRLRQHILKWGNRLLRNVVGEEELGVDERRVDGFRELKGIFLGQRRRRFQLISHEGLDASSSDNSRVMGSLPMREIICL